jgi:hypothetical protein
MKNLFSRISRSRGAVLLLSIISTTAARAQIIYPNNCYFGALTDYQTSWIANYGGVPRTHVPHSMESIFVRGDGTVATICGWDEGGTNVGIWKNGDLISIPQESGTGSYGRNSGKAVVVDDQYVYQLMRFNGKNDDGKLNSNGLRRYPPNSIGIEWQVITRYNISDGSPAVFPEGYGPLSNMLLVVTQEERLLQGLAIADNKLVVAVPGNPEFSIPDSLKIYDKTTMSTTPIGGYPITDGGTGYLYADKHNFVWMLQPNRKRIVAISLSNGGIRPQSTIQLPDDVDAKSFSIDTRENGQERILVANSGKDLNVLIYTNIYTNPTLSGTFGITGGNLVRSPKNDGGQYLQGEAGPLRFPGPTGVGVDNDGNIYISNMFATTPTAILYSYNEATQTENWRREGLAFTSTADFDQTQPNIAFSTDKMFELDYTKKGQRMDQLIASTLDPFTWPRDFRTEPNPPSPIKCGVFKRQIQGKDFLFVTNMYSSILGGYRFDRERNGYIAIPCMEIRIDGSRFWTDANGDGQQDDDEVKLFTAASTFSIYPDHDGNIWIADSNNPQSLRYWKLNGITSDGLLQYADQKVFVLPDHVTKVNRALYDTERDELLVSCYTQTHPNPNATIWGQVGTALLTFQRVTEKMAASPSGNWVYEQELLLPASPRTTQGTTLDPGVEISAKAITYAGDYIFCHLATGNINVYERSGNNLYVGQITPGNEVQKRVGWTDFTYALNARKNADGTYELLAEENAFAKILHYDLRSFRGDITRNGDLYPDTIWVCNAANAAIDPTDIPEGQSLKFTVRVRNIESGTVTNSRRDDQGRCRVSFKITDVDNNNVVFESFSSTHEQDIAAGDYVDMTVEDAWTYTQGHYSLEVNVNSGKKGKECIDTNNLATIAFSGGDNTGPITGLDDLRTDGKRLHLSPSPASDVLTVYLEDDPNTAGGYTFLLATPDGRPLIAKTISNHALIDVSALPAGIYLVRLTNATENITQKIIIR